MKDEILHHDLAHQKLNLQDEENLLRMLNDDLRQSTFIPIQMSFLPTKFISSSIASSLSATGA